MSLCPYRLTTQDKRQTDGRTSLKEEHFAFGIFPPKTKEILPWQQRQQNCWMPPNVIW